MNLIKNPVFHDNLYHKIIGDIVYVKCNDNLFEFDFTYLADGELTTPMEFIVLANKTGGVLSVSVMHAVDENGDLSDTDDDFDINHAEKVTIPWKTYQELEDERLIESLKPTQEEIDTANFEIKTINLLQDLEVL